ncbi:MAG TPA: hypothetical protein VHW23_24995 [Kofleriaceae bacterium]|nr:hypothetical protein [Kofleriaceae bacterium]
MRALCAVAVACVFAVAAVGSAAAGDPGGARRGEPRGAASIAVVRAVPSSLEAVVVHPAHHAMTARPARSRARASRPSLPVAALAAGGSLQRPGHAVIALRPSPDDCRSAPPVRTGSARGPPIG